MPKSSQASSNTQLVDAQKSALAELRRVSGEVSSTTLQRLDSLLPWYRAMPAARKSAIGMVAQSGITSFMNWCDNPTAGTWNAADIFGNAPQDLARSVSLQQTLQLIQISVEVMQERISASVPALQPLFLQYSRDVAFAAAHAYARAAEARGLWDSRLEALVVDSIMSGEYAEDLPSRISALGWHGLGKLSVLIGVPKPSFTEVGVRRAAFRMATDVLIGVQGRRVVVVMGQSDEHPMHAELKSEPSFEAVAEAISKQLSSKRTVLGPVVQSFREVSDSAKAALAGFLVVEAWEDAPRLVAADALLPERALDGDPLARATLIRKAYRPLAQHSEDILQTLNAYLSNGRSLEATARALFVHPNTVRYRLHRITELLGWDPTNPRDAYILQVALTLGTIDRLQHRHSA